MVIERLSVGSMVQKRVMERASKEVSMEKSSSLDYLPQVCSVFLYISFAGVCRDMFMCACIIYFLVK